MSNPSSNVTYSKYWKLKGLNLSMTSFILQRMPELGSVCRCGAVSVIQQPGSSVPIGINAMRWATEQGVDPRRQDRPLSPLNSVQTSTAVHPTPVERITGIPSRG